MMGRTNHNWIEEYVKELAAKALAGEPASEPRVSLNTVLKGRAIELWLADGDRLFIVADEDDAGKLHELRGRAYTAAELRCIAQIDDPQIVAEVHQWKRRFNGCIREYRKHGPEAG